MQAHPDKLLSVQLTFNPFFLLYRPSFKSLRPLRPHPHPSHLNTLKNKLFPLKTNSKISTSSELARQNFYWVSCKYPCQQKFRPRLLRLVRSCGQIKGRKKNLFLWIDGGGGREGWGKRGRGFSGGGNM